MVIISDKVYDYKDSTAVFKVILWHLCDPKKEPKYASPVYTALGSRLNTGKYIQVKKGDLVGYADSTGLSTGDHLHFGLKPIKTGKAPMSGDAPDVNIGDWVNIEQENGYLGAIDPEPYFDGTFVCTTQTPTQVSFPPYTSVSYEQALANLRKSGLSGMAYSLATWILKRKYKA